METNKEKNRIHGDRCLNRTMQYGNYTADDTPGNDLKV